MVTRIWLQTMCIVTAGLLALALVINFFMRETWINRSLEELEARTGVSAYAISDNHRFMVSRFVEIFGTDEFKQLFNRLAEAKQEDHVLLNNNVQDMLAAVIRQCPQVVSAALINRNDVAFYLLSNVAKTDALSYTMGNDISVFHQVTILPCMESPFVGQHQVIPIAIPIRTLAGSRLLTVADGAVDSSLMLYMFLDADRFNAQINVYTSTDFGTLMVMNRDMQVLNLPAESEAVVISDQLGIPELLASAFKENDVKGILKTNGYRVVWSETDINDIYAVCLVREEVLLDSQNGLLRYMPMILCSSLMLITLVALFVSRIISKPLKQLMSTIRSVGDGSYSSDMMLQRKDELGRLSTSIDSMYHTIQQQMEEISNERDAKVNAELRLISEQINPHFLYNTLEAINMEVYAHHRENASAMIQNLGEFLRIGLSFGNRIITVSRELQHVQAYVNIMNSRFNQHLIFSSSVDPGCMERRIPKVILQPLVENSIRHGLRVDADAAGLQDQFISVEVHAAEDGGMDLAVIDNGIGIDVEKAKKMLHTDPAQQRHVGLNNVYQRLRMQYGPGADITFDSIPYFRNTVCIHIPPETPSA